ncbi:MFS transporter [Stappia sp.]|uniref:MFS transporter n=1 Tax=Stappia sp. TaxID=1870903 RepID=UPI0032D9A743
MSSPSAADLARDDTSEIDPEGRAPVDAAQGPAARTHGSSPPLLARLVPLLIAAALLLGANGLAMTVVAVRGREVGLSDTVIGLFGSAYYAGFIVAVLLAPLLIRRVGHIRVFAALASMSAMSVLLLLVSEPWVSWAVLRFASGAAFCGTAMVLESWLNTLASNSERGRILSVYRIVDLGAVTGFQFLLPAFGAGGMEILVVIGLLFCAALIPVSLSRENNPPKQSPGRINYLALWRISPVAAVGVLTIGLTNGAFRTVGPVYAQAVGLDAEGLALLISLWVLAGALFQYPLGWASDRTDRRFVLIVATVGAGTACLFLSGATLPAAIYVGGFLFGGFALPLYSLSAAHANDHARAGQYVELAAGLTLFFALGAMTGPLLASLVMDRFGPGAFFVYTATLHLAFVGFVLMRLAKRSAVPADRRKRFVWLLRTSPMIFRLARSGRGAGRDRPR